MISCKDNSANKSNLAKEYFTEVKGGHYDILSSNITPNYNTPIRDTASILEIEKYMPVNKGSLDYKDYYAGIIIKYDSFYMISGISERLIGDIYINHHFLITYTYKDLNIDNCITRLTPEAPDDCIINNPYIAAFDIKIDGKTIKIDEGRMRAVDYEYTICDTFPEVDVSLQITDDGHILNCEQ